MYKSLTEHMTVGKCDRGRAQFHFWEHINRIFVAVFRTFTLERKVSGFPVPSPDLTNQTLPGLA